MKRLSIIVFMLGLCIVLTPSLSTAQMQVFSERLIDYGDYGRCFWTWQGDNSVVPKGWILEIYTATLNYFPSSEGTYGRADLAGRDANGSAVWRTQVVFVEPKKTVHLTFPGGLKLEQGGFVEVGFIEGDQGDIFVSFNGKLSRK